MKSTFAMMCLAATCTAAFGQTKENFMQQQAYAEMQRVSGQVDILQSNLNDLQLRMSKLEGGNDSKGIYQEIEALKASVADLRRELQNQRAEIVKDLSGRISKISAAAAPAPAPKPPPKKVEIRGEHIVEAGDTLSFIAQTFGTTVEKLKEVNNLKSTNLRIGQKIYLPK